MASSPPGSPTGIPPPRPMSALIRPAPPAQRSSSRMSIGSKAGRESRASNDDESRTAVKVAVRVRPPLQPTDPGFDLIPQRFQRSMVQTTSNTSVAIESPQGKKLFVFDRVFSSETQQDGVWEYLSESINAFLQGYNVSLLAYGQSGAGKSYTMGTSGPKEQGNVQAMGVIPRAATALFEQLDGATPKSSKRSSMSQLRSPSRYSISAPPPVSMPSVEKNWQLKATYVEIYNEQLRDLLLPENTQPNERNNVTIREDTKGNIILTGLRQVDINSVDDLLNALNFGSSIRQTDATAINAKSSRSHAVFSLNLVQRKGKTLSTGDKRRSMPLESMSASESWITTDSKLHFVDLAGSERLKNTGAQGDRAREGISINAGLAALGKVISQLSSRSGGSHVSYRDSRLTRLLQDSLGGNAITYMIACVTPAEFHLSETLNTVQYAQRARAIQSKPRIQATEEGDKQAIIERLKAEVAFLREQVRAAAERSNGDRRPVAAPDRTDRHGEREKELESQLLDTQENYSTLSQRHAKLIAEMAKARDNEAAETHFETGDSPDDRINRSNSFAQAVEQVVLEYEKTIQSLEHSLSSTRTVLSNTETTLLEKETKCAYIETINTQLQTRVQKLMDREANTENYLHDLETKLDGHTTGEEKNATIVMELRKEIARIRENEAGCEDYITTLEERLAEADQDAELMQREIDRLEQVIERQRSLGKLDSLLYELDNIQSDNKGAENEAEDANLANGHRRTVSERSTRSHVSRPSLGVRDLLPDVKEGAEEDAYEHSASVENTLAPRDASLRDYEDQPQSPAQSKFVADKLEDVTQELVDLRVEHENTLNEFENLHSKYEEALRTLSNLQDQVDEARHPRRNRDSALSVTIPDQTRPPSFLSDGRAGEVKDGTISSSRSLSSELSSAMVSPVTTEAPEVDADETPKGSEAKDSPTDQETVASDQIAINDSAMSSEIEKLKQLASEKEAAEQELARKYAQLESQHQETLDMVEELKTAVAKAKWQEPPSPRSTGPVIRRKSSQNIMQSDRAHRSFISLRNIASDNFQDHPDTMQNFEINLNAAMHELQARSERVQELEADIAAAKKEMETKMTIISGLTRERSSLKVSPMDMSVVANLREQLERNEQQLDQMQQAHLAREAELEAQVAVLRKSSESKIKAGETEHATSEPNNAEQDHKIAELEAELLAWEGKHQSALDAMQSAEKEMRQTISQLETEIAATQSKSEQAQSTASSKEEAKDIESEHDAQLVQLRTELEGYKSAVDGNADKVAELEKAHAATREQLNEAMVARDLATAETTTHKDLVAKLESQIAGHEQTLKGHQDSLAKLNADYAKEIEQVRASTKQEHEAQVNLLMAEHAENVRILESDAAEARDELLKAATKVALALGVDASVEKISEHIETLVSVKTSLDEERKRGGELEAHVSELSHINNTVMRDLEAVKSSLNDMLLSVGDSTKNAAAYPSVQEQLAAIKKRMFDLENKNKKHSRLVEELEDQLQTNYDQAQATNNRLSTLQTERHAQLEEATSAKNKAMAELEALRDEIAVLQNRVDETEPKRSNSINSQVRKTASVTSLPSPPPAIPLPPLPGPASPTQSPSNGRPQSNDLAMAQIREDQEARIKSIDKALFAERQLTQTLEDALTNLERQSNKVKADCDAWRKRAQELEGEVKDLKEKAPKDDRWRDSLHQIEEERKKRQDAERARTHLEERMNAINQKKKKKGSLNCF